MKKSFLPIISFLILLSSCTNDDDHQGNGELIYGKWSLTKITNTSIGGSASPDLNDTHFYLINEDGTFKRVSLKDNNAAELNGSYVLTDKNANYGNSNNSIQFFLELSYASEARFFNCGIIDDDRQLLILTSDNLLQNTLSGACDGENYEYTKE